MPVPAQTLSLHRPDRLDATPRRRATHRIVIVGGGAGGLELATRLGDKLGDASGPRSR